VRPLRAIQFIDVDGRSVLRSASRNAGGSHGKALVSPPLFDSLRQFINTIDRANERKKRQVFRGESLPLLPFEIQGMEEQAPTMEVSTIGTGELPYKIGREDVTGMYSFWCPVLHYLSM